MIKVSVILPVYGVAEYIEACTRSLLAQTLEEVEFLFVDDHGPDDSIGILQRTIEGHPRAAQFRVLRPEHNLGAGMARNFGIPEAKGEYIAFIDPDDTVEPDMLEHAAAAAQTPDGPADIVGWDWTLEKEKGGRYMCQADYEGPVQALSQMTGGASRWNLWLFPSRNRRLKRPGLINSVFLISMWKAITVSTVLPRKKRIKQRIG